MEQKEEKLEQEKKLSKLILRKARTNLLKTNPKRMLPTNRITVEGHAENVLNVRQKNSIQRSKRWE